MNFHAGSEFSGIPYPNTLPHLLLFGHLMTIRLLSAPVNPAAFRRTNPNPALLTDKIADKPADRRVVVKARLSWRPRRPFSATSAVKGFVGAASKNFFWLPALYPLSACATCLRSFCRNPVDYVLHRIFQNIVSYTKT